MESLETESPSAIRRRTFRDDMTSTKRDVYATQSYRAYAPQYYSIWRRALLEVAASCIFVFAQIALMTLYEYDHILMSLPILAIGKGVIYAAILAIFYHYGAGYINPLLISVIAISDYLWGAKKSGQRKRNSAISLAAEGSEDDSDKEGELIYSSHVVGKYFILFVIAQFVGMFLAILFLYLCFDSVAPATHYGYAQFEYSTFGAGRILFLDAILLSIIFSAKLLSGSRRKTIGERLPIICGGAEVVMAAITHFTSLGLNNMLVWLAAAVLSNFGGHGVTSIEALDGWLVLGSNAIAAILALLFASVFPRKEEHSRKHSS